MLLEASSSDEQLAMLGELMYQVCKHFELLGLLAYMLVNVFECFFSLISTLARKDMSLA